MIFKDYKFNENILAVLDKIQVVLQVLPCLPPQWEQKHEHSMNA
jgi:hypothetical protein